MSVFFIIPLIGSYFNVTLKSIGQQHRSHLLSSFMKCALHPSQIASLIALISSGTFSKRYPSSSHLSVRLTASAMPLLHGSGCRSFVCVEPIVPLFRCAVGTVVRERQVVGVQFLVLPQENVHRVNHIVHVFHIFHFEPARFRYFY